MPAIELLGDFIGIHSQGLSKKENFLLEAEFFIQMYEALKDFFKPQYQNYFRVMKFTNEIENKMLELDLFPHVINDLLKSEDYSLEGIAYYTQTSDEVISDIVSGINTAPSFPLTRKIIDLHRSVRPDLYREIMRKIVSNIN
jgi:hypothetical protein